MKKFHLIISLALLSFLGFNCQKEASFQGNPSNNTGDKIRTTLQGNIFDESGRPAMGVTIKVDGKTVVTNAKGYFRVANANLGKNAALVTAEKTGYFKAYRVFNATSGVNQVVIKLVKKESAGTINTASGGDVMLSNGAKISLPANGVMKASGGAYSGSVKVYAAYIDPTNQEINQLVPGSFLGTDKNNKEVILTSYGMMTVELESPAGEKLQVAGNSTATLTVPIPASGQASAPTTIPMWYVDEQTGIWKEEGTATRNGANYVGQVKHFTYWNCDAAGPTINLTATFHTADGSPLVNVQVEIVPISGYGCAHGNTDSLGQISGPVPANVNLVLTVKNQCYATIHTQNIGPFSSNTNLGVITVSSPGGMVWTVKGTLLNCSNAPVTSGYAIINYGVYVAYAQTDNNGKFNISFAACNSSTPTTCEILGVDNLANQQGAFINFTITPPVTNVGNVSACGTSTLQYVNFTMDGVNYSASNTTPGDAIYSNTHDTVTVGTTTYIYASRANSVYTSLEFNSNGAAGIFPMTSIYVPIYNTPTLIAPFDVTVTNFPLTGGFYEGSYSGQFKDASNNIHTISCSFRARRL